MTSATVIHTEVISHTAIDAVLSMGAPLYSRTPGIIVKAIAPVIERVIKHRSRRTISLLAMRLYYGWSLVSAYKERILRAWLVAWRVSPINVKSKLFNH